jgi:hypothetical protein
MDHYGDIMVHPTVSSEVNQLAIRRRGAKDQYNLIYSSSEYGSEAPKTNGNWVAAPLDTTTAVLEVLDNDTVVYKSSLSSSYLTGSFFPNNVFVGYSTDGEKLDIYTLDSDWTFAGDFYPLGSPFPSDGRLSQDQRYVVVHNDTHLNIYEYLSADITFTLVESFEYNTTYNWHSFYNGNDSVVVMTDEIEISTENSVLFGGAVVYQKVNGEWIEKQTFDGLSLGFRGEGYLGVTGTFYNQNTMVLLAPADNTDNLQGEKGPAGTVYVLGRDGGTGTWSQMYQIYSDEKVKFGYNVFVSDTSMIIPGFTSNFLGAPYGYMFSINKCIGFPIDVTCKDFQLDDCSSITFDALYSINELECGPVEMSVGSMDLSKSNEATVTYNFSKLGLSATCNATVMCPAPPVVVSAPVTGTTPVLGAPVATSAPTGKTSGSNSIVVGGLATLLIGTMLV